MSQYRNIQLTTGLPFNVKPIIDITDQLPSRSPDPETPRTPDQITFISVHHSGVEGGSPRSYADYHVNTRKWYHIGYHAVVEGDQIYQTNDLMTFSYHTSGNNHYTVSVSVSGDFTKRALTDVERNCLYGTIITYMEMFNVPVENVLGHHEYPGNETTDCPGFSMEQVRSDIRAISNQMKYAKSPQSAQTTAFKIANQILWLYNLAQGKNADGTPATPGNMAWATQMLLKMEPFMNDNKLFG